MYADKTTLVPYSKVALLKDRGVVSAKDHDLTAEQLEMLNAAAIVEPADTSGIRTGAVVNNAGVYEWEYRALTLTEKQQRAKGECAKRIRAVADQTAQLNLAAAAAAGVLTTEQMAAYVSGVAWIASMRTQWPIIADNSLDPTDNANWPDVPAGVAELGAAF